MTPARLASSDVETVLGHIPAVPSALFSLPSRQRHRFLGIDPHDPHEYLAWPFPHSAAAVDRLLSQHFLPEYSVAYTADPESAFAHCHLRTIRDTPPAPPAPDLRLVFQWDASASRWKFHTVALMPFPHPSASSPSTTTMNPLFRDDFLHEPDAVHVETSDDRDDPYWNTYGQPDHTPDDAISSRRVAADPKAEHHTASEDAYWARYAAVQGSADSTQPSPLPNKRNKSNHLPTDPSNPHLQSHSRNEPAFSHPPLHPHSQQNQDFPSPHTLTERLIAISARLPASPLDDPESPESRNSDVITSANLIPVADSFSDSEISPSPSPGLVKLGVNSAGSPERRIPIDISVITAPSPPLHSLGDEPEAPPKERQFGPEAQPSPPRSGDEGAEALRESIRGVYRLWKVGRQLPPHGTVKPSEKDIFLDLVHQAIREC